MNFVTGPSQIVTRFRRGFAAAMLGLAAGVPMLAAAPAFADHNNVQVVVSKGHFTFGLSSGPSGGVSCAPVVRCAPVDSWAVRDFERGQCAARNDGAREGFNDGLRDCFDLRIRMDSCRVSRPFEDGYRSTYKNAYSDAFQKGRCERLARIERERCERERWERQRHGHVHVSRGHGGWGPSWRR